MRNRAAIKAPVLVGVGAMLLVRRTRRTLVAPAETTAFAGERERMMLAR
jgi:hypothetical protein